MLERTRLKQGVGFGIKISNLKPDKAMQQRRFMLGSRSLRIRLGEASVRQNIGQHHNI